MNMGSAVRLTKSELQPFICLRQLSNPTNVNVRNDNTIAKIMRIKWDNVPIALNDRYYIVDWCLNVKNAILIYILK